MIQLVKKFTRLSAVRKKLLLQTLILSVYTQVLFRFFKKHASFGKAADIDSKPQQPDAKALDIAYAIQAVDKLVPWQNVCRHQAYQAKMLCSWNRLPYMIFVGFKKDKETNKIQAHAWTVAGGKIITGFCKPNEYTIQNVYQNEWQ